MLERRNNIITSTYENEVAAFELVEVPVFELADSRLGFAVIMAMSALVGVWGASSIISGILGATTISGLGRGFVTALTGI